MYVYHFCWEKTFYESSFSISFHKSQFLCHIKYAKVCVCVCAILRSCKESYSISYDMMKFAAKNSISEGEMHSFSCFYLEFSKIILHLAYTTMLILSFTFIRSHHVKITTYTHTHTHPFGKKE